MKQPVMGIEFDNCTMQQAVETGCRLMNRQGSDYVVTPNAEIVYASGRQPELLQALNNASLVLPDGIGVVYASRILKTPLKEKVAGIDFGSAMLQIAAERGWRVFLLGARPGVAQLAKEKLCEKYPGLRIVGVHDGYFTDNSAVTAQIRQVDTQLLLVCLGAPKQELWMAEYAGQTGASLLVGLGGSLDIYAGISQRAPDIWIKLGLEWAYRLMKEPWRIRRQLCLPKFLITAVCMRILGKR